MECEMCGNAQASARARVEGVEMSVCARCATHGSVTRQIAPPARKPKASAPRAMAQDRSQPDLLESVHPDVAKFLRAHRQKLGLTQEDFARKLSIKVSAYQHYESGSTKPDIALARKLEHELHVPLVVHLKTSAGPMGAHDDAQGMTLADFVKKGKKK